MSEVLKMLRVETSDVEDHFKLCEKTVS